LARTSTQNSEVSNGRQFQKRRVRIIWNETKFIVIAKVLQSSGEHGESEESVERFPCRRCSNSENGMNELVLEKMRNKKQNISLRHSTQTFRVFPSFFF